MSDFFDEAMSAAISSSFSSVLNLFLLLEMTELRSSCEGLGCLCKGQN